MPSRSLAQYLSAMIEQNATDLHISVGVPPEYRILGKVVRIKEPPLSQQESKDLCYSVLSEEQKGEFEKRLELDFGFAVKGVARFRGNIFYTRRGVAAVFRKIPLEIPTFQDLGLPVGIVPVLKRASGLILVTGPTGSGKSTTIASMLDLLNRERQGHIITLEDPIEYIIPHRNCIVNQREIGKDSRSFKQAMKRLFRQDPDYIMIGELRDTETMSLALSLAETGHLVFTTLHTNGSIQAVYRMVNSFPPHQQTQILQSLSSCVQLILSQQLIMRDDMDRLVLAYELLIPTAGIRAQIRENKIHQIYAMMQAGQGDTEMVTMNQRLIKMVIKGMVHIEKAIQHSPEPEDLARVYQTLLKKAGGHHG